MNADLLMVIGVILAVFTIPSVISALTDGRTPRITAFVAVVAGSLIVWAINEKPSGYTLEEIPQAFVNVIGRYVN
jgi:MFS superfamily sulfate permease-like transporter